MKILVFYYEYGMGGWGDVIKGLHTCWCWAKASGRQLKIDFSRHAFGIVFLQHRYLDGKEVQPTLHSIDRLGEYTSESLGKYADQEEIVVTCNWFVPRCIGKVDPLPFFKELYTEIFPLTIAIERQIPAVYHTFHCRVGDKYLVEAHGSKDDNRIDSFDRLETAIKDYCALGHPATLVASDSEAVVTRLLAAIPGAFTLCPAPYHTSSWSPAIESNMNQFRDTIIEHYAMTKSLGIYMVAYSGFPITAAAVNNIPLQMWSKDGKLAPYNDEHLDYIRELNKKSQSVRELMNKTSLSEKITECVLTQTPIIFGKYGDGEYICVFGNKSTAQSSFSGADEVQNSDNDAYTEKKKAGLIAAIQFMNGIEYAYIGKWGEDFVTIAWQSLCVKPIQWADYMALFIISGQPEGNQKVLAMYRAIKNSPLKKIMVCNPSMKRAKALLNIDCMVHVPLSNWFDDHCEEVVAEVLGCMEGEDMCIVITCCGMGAKVLQYRIAQVRPKGIYLDVGSALDTISTKVKTRTVSGGYAHDHSIWKDDLPKHWDAEPLLGDGSGGVTPSLCFIMSTQLGSGEVTGMSETIGGTTPSPRYGCVLQKQANTITITRNYITVKNNVQSPAALRLKTFEQPQGVPTAYGATCNICAYDLQQNASPAFALLAAVAGGVEVPLAFPSWGSIVGKLPATPSAPANPIPFLSPVPAPGVGATGAYYRYVVRAEDAVPLALAPAAAAVSALVPCIAGAVAGPTASYCGTLSINDLYPPAAGGVVNILNTTGMPLFVNFQYQLPALTGPLLTGVTALPNQSSAPMLQKSPSSAVISFDSKFASGYAIPAVATVTKGSTYSVPLPLKPTVLPPGACPLALISAGAVYGSGNGASAYFFYCNYLTDGQVYVLTAAPITPPYKFSLVNQLTTYSVQAVYNDPLLPCSGGGSASGDVGKAPSRYRNRAPSKGPSPSPSPSPSPTEGPTATKMLIVDALNVGSQPLRHGATITFYLYHKEASGGYTPMIGNSGAPVPTWTPASFTQNLASVTGVVDMQAGQLVGASAATTMTLAVNGFQCVLSLTGGVATGKPLAFTVARVAPAVYGSVKPVSRALFNDLGITVQYTTDTNAAAEGAWTALAPYQSEIVTCGVTDSVYVRTVDCAYGVTFPPSISNAAIPGIPEFVCTVGAADVYTVSGLDPLGLLASTPSTEANAVCVNVVNLSMVQCNLTSPATGNAITPSLNWQATPLLYGPGGAPGGTGSAWSLTSGTATAVTCVMGLTASIDVNIGTNILHGTTTITTTLLDLLQFNQNKDAAANAALQCVVTSGYNYPPAPAGGTWPAVMPPPQAWDAADSSEWLAYASQHPVLTLYILDTARYISFATSPGTSAATTAFTTTIVFTPASAAMQPITTVVTGGASASPVLPAAQPSLSDSDTFSISTVYGGGTGGTGTGGTGTGGTGTTSTVSFTVGALFGNAPSAPYKSQAPAYTITANPVSRLTVSPAAAFVTINAMSQFVFSMPSPVPPGGAGVSLDITYDSSTATVTGTSASSAAFTVYGDLLQADARRPAFNFTYNTPGMPPCVIPGIDASVIACASLNSAYINAELQFLTLVSSGTDAVTGINTVSVTFLASPVVPCNAPYPSSSPGSTPAPEPSSGPIPAGGSGGHGHGPAASRPHAHARKKMSTTTIVVIVVCAVAFVAVIAAICIAASKGKGKALKIKK